MFCIYCKKEFGGKEFKLSKCDECTEDPKTYMVWGAGSGLKYVEQRMRNDRMLNLKAEWPAQIPKGEWPIIIATHWGI